MTHIEIVPVNDDYNIMVKTFASNGNLIAFRNCSFDIQGVIFFANKPTQIEMSSSSFKLERIVMIITLSNIYTCDEVGSNYPNSAVFSKLGEFLSLLRKQFCDRESC